MRALVTGGAGFIGSNLVQHLMRWGHEVVVLDDLRTGHRHDYEKAIHGALFIKGEVADIRHLVRDIGWFDTVFHLAAETHVDRSMVEPARFWNANVWGTMALLELVRGRADAPFIVLASTDEVYGPTDTPVKEDAPLRPSSPYASSKAAADLLALSYFTTYSTPLSIVRMGNAFGPGQHPEKLIPKALAATSSNPLPLYGEGLQTREWTWVGYLCNALALAGVRQQAGEVYNASAGVSMTNQEVLKLLGVASGRPVWVTNVEDPRGACHDFSYRMDCGHLRKAGWTVLPPQYHLREWVTGLG